MLHSLSFGNQHDSTILAYISIVQHTLFKMSLEDVDSEGRFHDLDETNQWYNVGLHRSITLPLRNMLSFPRTRAQSDLPSYNLTQDPLRQPEPIVAQTLDSGDANDLSSASPPCRITSQQKSRNTTRLPPSYATIDTYAEVKILQSCKQISNMASTFKLFEGGAGVPLLGIRAHK